MTGRETRKRILIIGGSAFSLRLFRAELIEAMRAGGHVVIACASPPETDLIAGFDEDQLNQLVTKFVPIPLIRTTLNPLRDLLLLWQLFGVMVREKPDIVLSYTIKPIIYGSLAAFFCPGARSYSIITGLGYAFTELEGEDRLRTLRRKLANFMARILYRIALPANQKVFFQNPDDRSLFINLRLTDESKTILLNGSGVNTEYFAPAPLVISPARFLMITRLLKDKGILEFVEAARLIRQQYPETVLQILGRFDAHPNAITEAQIRAWEAEGIVEWAEAVADVRPYIRAASVYVLPSYREGTPRTILEAMAMGRPIITTDVPGCRETVIDGENGFLVPAQNARALAEKMAMFIRQPDLIISMGRRSREIVVERYDVHQVNHTILRAMRLL